MKVITSLSSFQILLLCSLTSLAIFAFDIATPLGFAGGVPYVFVILLSLFSQEKHLTIRVTIAASLLTLMGIFLSPAGGELWQVVLNRILAIFVIWCTAILGIKLKSTISAKQDTEDELQKIFELSPDMIGKGTLNGVFTEVNSAVTKLLGYPKEDFILKPFIDFVHKDDVENTLNALQEATQGNKNILVNNRYRCIDGSYKWLEWNVLSNTDENIFYAVGRNITKRVLAEQQVEQMNKRLASAQKIAHIGHWVYDFTTEEASWSDEFYTIFEKDNLATVNHRSYFDLIHPDDKDEVLDIYKASLKNKTSYHTEHRILLPSKSVKHVALHGETSFDENNRPLISSGIIQNITEQVELKERMRNSQKMDALGQLTGGIAHDYNNMLGIIIGYSEILEKQLEEQPTLCNYAKQITTSGRRGAELTNKLLSFSKKNNVSANCVLINTLINESKEVIQKSLTSTIDLHLDLASNLWSAKIDTFAFDDMLLNLCINAKHAMPNGGKLEISTKNKNLTLKEAENLNLKATEYILLSVTDTGIGMSEEVKQKIFEPFFTTKGEKGTGLGLSQVYSFINASSGTIKVSSQLNKGTKFDIYLPKCCKKKTKITPVVIEKPATKASTASDISILVVDDEEALTHLLTTILSDEGYQILSASSGVEALTIVNQHKVDLLLTDILMPQMNGYQLAEQVLSLFPEMAIIFTSGYQDSLDKLQPEKLLSLPLITKPYNKSKLLNTIKESLPQNTSATHSNKQEQATAVIKEPVIAWSPEMVIDNGIIDEDHRQLLTLLSRCQQLDENDEHFADNMQLLIDELANYTLDHFAREELAMEVCNYPFAKNHRDVHALMARELQSVIKTKSPKALRNWVIFYLSSWLLDHIMVMDKALSSFIESKPLEVQQALATIKSKGQSND